MTLKPEEYLELAAQAEASAKRASSPAIRQRSLDLAKAFREMARLLKTGRDKPTPKVSA